MDKKKALDKSKKAVTTFFKVRRAFKIFLAFGSGVSATIVSFRQLYDVIENVPLSVYYAILAGVATTVFALLFIETIRVLIGKLKKLGLWLLAKHKDKAKEKQIDEQ